MNVKRLPVILLLASLVLGIMLLNGCKEEEKTKGSASTTKSATTTLSPPKTTEKETTTEKKETTTVAASTSTTSTSTTTSAAKTTTKATAAATTTTTVASGTYLNIENDMLNLVNTERSKVGKNSLTLSTELCNCAKIRAKELATLYSHTRPDGTSCFTVFEEYNIEYRYAGENIAYGTTNYYGTNEIFNNWMNSPPHKSNILSEECEFNQFGCAAYTYGDLTYWVQLFMYS